MCLLVLRARAGLLGASSLFERSQLAIAFSDRSSHASHIFAVPANRSCARSGPKCTAAASSCTGPASKSPSACPCPTRRPRPTPTTWRASARGAGTRARSAASSARAARRAPRACATSRRPAAARRAGRCSCSGTARVTIFCRALFPQERNRCGCTGRWPGRSLSPSALRFHDRWTTST